MVRAKNTAITIAASAIAVASCLCDRVAWGNDDDNQAVQGTPRFVGRLLASRRNGKTVPLSVDIRIWNISENRVELPVSGFFIASAISGDLVAVINGRSETHSSGDFWTVPDGVPMLVAAQGEAAILETIAVNIARVFGENERPF